MGKDACDIWLLVITEGTGFTNLLPVGLYLESGRDAAVNDSLIGLTIAGFNPVLYQRTLDTFCCTGFVRPVLYIT